MTHTRGISIVTDRELTEEETKALRALGKLAKQWPRSLMLFSNSGSLEVGRTGMSREGPGTLVFWLVFIYAHLATKWGALGMGLAVAWWFW